jgi:glycerol-3-phosphate acyltransferase PlsY
MWLQYGANVVLGFLLGSVPFGLVVGYIWLRKDIRTIGSGKTGTTNVLRTAGKVPAALVVIGDISKGAIPAIIGRFLFDDWGIAAAGAVAAVVGHIWPVFAGFRGGRGVATAFGAFLVLAPLAGVIGLGIGAIILVATRYVSLMSILGTALVALMMVAAAIVGWTPVAAMVFTLVAVGLIEYMHIPNMRRLLAGTEPRIGRGGDRPATG